MFLIERYRHPRTKAMGDTSICTADPADGQSPQQALLACAWQLGAKVSCETVTGIISLTPSQASPDQLLTCNRHHWGIENGLHHRRDTTYGEDASRVRTGSAPASSPRSTTWSSACSTALGTPTMPVPGVISAGTTPASSAPLNSSACDQNDTCELHHKIRTLTSALGEADGPRADLGCRLQNPACEWCCRCIMEQ